ncbi:hypothetical protein D3C76_1009780 [compost metagenome]
MHWGDDLAVLFRFAQLGVDEVHPVVRELTLVDQIILDAAGAFLAQLTQQHFAGAPELDHVRTHFRRAFFLAQVFPFGGRLDLQARAVDPFEQRTFLAVRHLQQIRLRRHLVAAALEHFVVVVLIFPFQALLGEQRTITALGGGAFDFQAQGRAFLEGLGQFDQCRFGVLAQVARARRE